MEALLGSDRGILKSDDPVIDKQPLEYFIEIYACSTQ